MAIARTPPPGTPGAAAFCVTAEGVRLAVRLTPRGGRDGLIGVTTEVDGRAALRLRVAAPPVEGAANAALVANLAAALKLRRGDITILSGQSGRLKMLEIRGDGALIAAKLTAWIG